MYDRHMTVGASDAVHIQKGDWAQLWDLKQLASRPEPGLEARIGYACERINREIFSEQTGLHLTYSLVWDENPFTLPGSDWYTLIPDALIIQNNLRIPFEGKAIHCMWQPHLLRKKYMPQLQHAMRVMEAPYCYFSVIYLNTKWEFDKISYDEPYADALFEKEKLFYWFLKEKQRPPEWAGKRKGWI